MATHDYNIANAAGATVRSDLNNALSAINSTNSNTTTPADEVAGSQWLDTTLNIWKIRNAADNATYSLLDMATGELLANLGDGLIVNSGDSGATATADSNDFVVESAGHGGISIIIPNASKGSLAFGNVADSVTALIEADYNSNLFNVGSHAGGIQMVLKADNDITNLTLSGASSSELATFAGDVTLTAGDLLLSAGTGHIINGSSGATATANYGDDFVVESSSHAGMTIMCPDASLATLFLGVASDSSAAGLQYQHSTLKLYNGPAITGGINVLTSDNQATNLTLTGGSGVEVATFTGDVITPLGQRHTAQASETSKTIASGTFAIDTHDYLIKIDAEGAPTTDTLDTITGGTDGQRIRLCAAPLDTITITHNATPSAGEFFSGSLANISLGGQYAHAEFINYSGIWVQAK